MSECYDLYVGFFTSDRGVSLRVCMANDIPDSCLWSLNNVTAMLALPKFIQSIINFVGGFFTKIRKCSGHT